MYYYPEKLETKRLTTRFLCEDDTPLWSEFFRDREAFKFFTWLGNASPEEMASQWIARQLKRYEDKTYGLQALFEKETNHFVGQAGLLTQEVEGKTETEVSYHVIKKYWGNGYAPEVARMFISLAFSNNLTDSIISIIDKRNLKSQRVAEKNGLKIDGETYWFGNDVYIYRIRKESWHVQDF